MKRCISPVVRQEIILECQPVKRRNFLTPIETNWGTANRSSAPGLKLMKLKDIIVRFMQVNK
jgi:hypothetical protein